MIGENEAIELAVIAIIAKGHVLLEDVPRTGTTSLAKVFHSTYYLTVTSV